MSLQIQIKTECLDKLKASAVWDARYNLPTFPRFNNPWIYMAYVALLLKQADERKAWKTLKLDLDYFTEHCEVDFGLLNRWPDGAGGTFSHDEIMGAAYLDAALAERVLTRLELENGRYDNKETDNDITEQEYRFIFMVPFLKACAGRKVGMFSQIVWCLTLIEHSITHKLGDESGTLKIWLMLDVMERFYLCRWVGAYWQKRMRKHGLNGIKDVFKHYLNDNPVLVEIASDRF